MTERGKFIVFEGVNGCGKGTQISYAEKLLKNNGYKVKLTREPGGTKAGEQIRNLIFKLRSENGEDGKPLINSGEQMVLFFACRHLLAKNIVEPNVKKGKIVLSDRLHPSTGAFQGYGEGGDMKKILKIADIVLEKNRPDAIILLDLDPEKAVERSKKRNVTDDPWDRQQLEFFQKVVNGYREMARTNWDNLHWYMVDGTPEIEKVSQGIKQTLEDILQKKLLG